MIWVIDFSQCDNFIIEAKATSGLYHSISQRKES